VIKDTSTRTGSICDIDQLQEVEYIKKLAV
jgi:hypothetical protein